MASTERSRPAAVAIAPAGPEDVALMALEGLGLGPIVLHSTSWRHAGSEVILTYLAVVSPEAALPDSWQASPVTHVELARGGATTTTPVVVVGQVVEHALRHLAWLVREDETIAANLPGWSVILEGYVPEPFRALSEREASEPQPRRWGLKRDWPSPAVGSGCLRTYAGPA